MLDRAGAATTAADVDGARRRTSRRTSDKVDEKLDIVETLQPTDGLRKAVEAWLRQGLRQ